MAPETTSPTSAASISRRPLRRARAGADRGFTLVEMLVVIGIILLILGLASPMITRAWRGADRAATYNDIQVIASALESYKTDHGDYPRVAAPYTGSGAPVDFNGARMLCRALVAPGPQGGTPTPAANKVADGADGPGFRVRGIQGKVYGPYVQVEKFKLGDPSQQNPRVTGTTPEGNLAILDRYGRPFLYYPAKGRPNIRITGGFIDDYADNAQKHSLFNVRDNPGRTAPNPQGLNKAAFSQMMGDLNGNGMIDKDETPASEGPFVLWSAGPDETFGPNPPVAGTDRAAILKAVDKSDDVTSFRK